VIRIEEGKIRSHVDQVVRETVEQTLNGLLQAEADELCGAQRYVRFTRAARHAGRALLPQVADPGRRGDAVGAAAAEPAVRDRDHRALPAPRIGVEEALVEMYLAGVSVRRVEDITEALWGTRVSPSTVSELNQKIYTQIDTWRNRPIEGEHAYVYVDGIWFEAKLGWRGEERRSAGGHRRAFRWLP